MSTLSVLYYHTRLWMGSSGSSWTAAMDQALSASPAGRWTMGIGTLSFWISTRILPASHLTTPMWSDGELLSTFSPSASTTPSTLGPRCQLPVAFRARKRLKSWVDFKDAWTRSSLMTISCHSKTNAATLLKWQNWQNWSSAVSYILIPVQGYRARMEGLVLAYHLVVSCNIAL